MTSRFDLIGALAALSVLLALALSPADAAIGAFLGACYLIATRRPLLSRGRLPDFQ